MPDAAVDDAPETAVLTRSRAGAAAAATACLAAFLLLAAMVLRLAVNAPFGDEWELVPILEKAAAGTLAPADLWAQHNEHRLVFPQLAFLGLAGATRWDIRAENAASLVLAAGLFGLLFALLRSTLPPARRGWLPAAAVVLAWAVVSPIQWENWLWGWQLQWFMNALAAVAAVVCLVMAADGRRWLWAAAAVAAAVVASYSLANGLFVWVACLPLLVARRRLWRVLPVWAVAGAGSVAAYLAGYHKPAGHPPLRYFLDHPRAYASYILRYLGTPLTPVNAISPHAGLAVLLVFGGAAAFVLLRRRDRIGEAAAWVAVGGYVLLGAASTGVGRLGLGVEQANSSRYTTPAILFALSALALVLVAAGAGRRTRGPGRAVALGVAAALAIGLASAYPRGYLGMIGRQRQMLEVRACLLRASGPQDPCLTQTYPSGELAWTWLTYLRAQRLAGMG